MIAWLILLLMWLSSPAWSQQGQVLQTGQVTPGHVTVWATNGVVQDGGATPALVPGVAQLLGSNGSAFVPVSVGSGLTLNAGVLSTSGAGSGTVTSVGLSLPSIFSVSGSPVTTAGTLTGTFQTQTANLVFAGPMNGAPAQPTFRALGLTDLPSLSANTVLGALTATTPSGLSLPSCSTNLSALDWTSGTGFGCNTFGSMALQNANNVAITGGAISGVTLGPSTSSTVFLATGGTGTGAQCYNSGTPCGTMQDAIAAVGLIVGGDSNGNVTISIQDAGPFPGFGITGGAAIAGAKWRTSAGQQSLVNIVGQVASPAVFSSQVTVSDYANVLFNNVVFTASLGDNAALLTQFHGNSVVNSATCQLSVSSPPTANTAVCFNTDLLGMLTVQGPLTLTNTGWAYPFQEEYGGVMSWGSTLAITCASDFTSQYFVKAQGSVFNENVNPTYTTCDGKESIGAMYAQGNTTWRRFDPTTYVPGPVNRISAQNDTVPVPIPTLTSCTNGAFQGSGWNNYSGLIGFSGSSTTCTVVYSFPAGNPSGWFLAIPSPQISSNVPVLLTAKSATSFTFSGTFVSGSFVSFTVTPNGEG